MARALVIEEESGTYRGHVHPHNGYYAGDFSNFADVSFPQAAAYCQAVTAPWAGL